MPVVSTEKTPVAAAAPLASNDFAIDYDALTTEDDAPVDNILSEKLQRLLVQILHAAVWTSRNFLAAANVGVFYAVNKPPIVPDMFLAYDVEGADDWTKKENKSYFVWRFGKPPDLVVEIVSNAIGGEDGDKLAKYAEMGVKYYVIHDPFHYLGETTLQAFALNAGVFEPCDPAWLPNVKLGLIEWEGTFEGSRGTWLRWVDAEGSVLPTGEERASTAEARAESEHRRAKAEKRRADRLARKLRELGVDPDSL
jgi:Uma2 family endonuclease